MRKAEREQLRPGDTLELTQVDAQGRAYVQKAVVEKFLGQGSSSLVYQVKLLMADGSRYLTMVMKEFYPCSTHNEVFVIKRDGCRLKIRGETARLEEFRQRLAQFRDGYEKQNELSNSDAMEVMVKPFTMASCGDSYYILSDVHMGRALRPEHFVTMQEKLQAIVRVAEMIQILHEQGYIFLDFKPDNMLWIDRPKGVKLLDFDSLVNLQDLDSVHVEDIRYDTRYGAPEIRRLFQYDSMSFEQKKYSYLKPRADIYCIGQLLFQLIFGHLPSAGELSFNNEVKREFTRLCRKAECSSEDAVDKLWQICQGCLQKRSIFRYASAGELADEVNAVIRMLGSEPYILKKQIQQANHTIAVCNLLEKYPVYHFAETVDGCSSPESSGDVCKVRRNLDISIIGSHEIRRQMISSIASCVQMLDSGISLRLFGRDSMELLKSMMTENPAMKKAVTVFLHGTPRVCQDKVSFEQEKMILDQVDHTIVEEPLVEFHVYPLMAPDEIVSVIDEAGSFYILCLEKNVKETMEMARALMKKGVQTERRKFIGVLGADGLQLEELAAELPTELSASQTVTLAPITLKKKSREYDERFIRNDIGKRALAVHTFYYRGYNEQASPEKILSDYKSSDYNAYSSMRAALSITYKFGSIGLDIHSRNAPEEFWHKVLDGSEEAKKLLDRLAALEHRSWTAYLIFDGWDVPEDEDEIRKYAFTGKNDFKDKKRRLHPCLKASRPGLGLRNFSRADWDNPASEKWEKLDPLDHMSAVLHQIAGEKAREAREKIRQQMEEMDISSGDMEPEQKIIREYECCHDYKRSDQDIVEAIPRILAMYDQGKKVERTLIKPVCGGDESLENILGALYLDPDRLLLVPMGENGEKAPDIAYYRDFLKKRGIAAQVEIREKSRLRRFSGKTYVDLTALKDPVKRSELLKLHCLDHACRFEIRENRLCPMDDTSVLIYNRDIHFSVEEICFLKGIGVESCSGKERIISAFGKNCSPQRIFRYQDIWKVCRKVDSREWSELIRLLTESGKNGRYQFSVEKGELTRYWTEPVPCPLPELCGLDRVLKACKKEGLLLEYVLPGKEDELPLEFVTDLPMLAACIQELVRLVLAEPFRHHFTLVKEGGEWLVDDETLYVDGCISRPSQVRLAKSLLPRFAGQNRWENARKPLQNLTMKDTVEGLSFSFKYASRAVKEIFERENHILNALVYFRCMNQGLFDDIRIFQDYMLCSRNMEICLISVQSGPVTEKSLQETLEYARRLNTGQIVLINTGYETGSRLEEHVKKLAGKEDIQFCCAGKSELMKADFII